MRMVLLKPLQNQRCNEKIENSQRKVHFRTETSKPVNFWVSVKIPLISTNQRDFSPRRRSKEAKICKINQHFAAKREILNLRKVFENFYDDLSF